MAFAGRGTARAPAVTLAVVVGLPPHVPARRRDRSGGYTPCSSASQSSPTPPSAAIAGRSQARAGPAAARASQAGPERRVRVPADPSEGIGPHHVCGGPWRPAAHEQLG